MPLLAVGGGTIGDLAGTAAALYARGIPLIQVPTTWLAQADSAIGGKVAVDLGDAKNAVGAFWPPVAVISDVATLRSLPIGQRRDGMAESVKSSLIGDPALWRLIEDRGAAALRTDEPARFAIIERSARLKLGVCDRDPYEDGERRTLNLGHTIGHGVEIESGYGLSHGAAVALGLRAVAAIAAGRGGDPQLADRLDSLLDGLGFALRRTFDPAAVRAAMLGDKKRHAGRQRWILPMEIGRVSEVDDVTDAEIDARAADDRRMTTVAYQGEPGAFGEEAVVGWFGDDATPMPMPTFSAVCGAVEDGTTDAGVLPLENSLAGTVGDALDALADGELRVVGELLLPIRHQLLVLPGVEIGAIRRVSSHWQALSQCERFLSDRGWDVVPAADTAGAARELAASGERGSGGHRIGPRCRALRARDRGDGHPGCRPQHDALRRSSAR